MSDRSRARQNTIPVTQPTLNDRLIELSALLLLIPALLPLLVVFSPSLYLESDPRQTAEAANVTISFGPTGSMWLASASLLISAFTLWVTVKAGGRLRVFSCVLVAAGIVPCLLHLNEHFNSLLHGSAWIAAASLGLAAIHLSQFNRAKRIIVAALIAIGFPLFLQAAWYVYVEHPQTIESFRANLDENLIRRGLSPDSPEAAKYMTRLEGNDVIGAIGMSNVYGSLVAAMTMITLISLVGAWRKHAAKGRLVVIAVLLLLSLWTLKLTQSKGAVLALVAAGGLAIFALGVVRFKLKPRALLPIVCIALVLAGSAAVIARGSLGPPKDATGERSLLFRYHYWQGAIRILTEQPSRILLGAGSGEFKSLYDTARNPISPEVVSSTHNVFVDYTVMLGLGGLFWGLLLLGWLWQAGVSLGNQSSESVQTERGPPAFKPIVLFGLLAAIVFLTQYAVQFPGLYAETAILWLIGVSGFVALSVYVILPAIENDTYLMKAGIVFAAVLLLLHAQIEMTFFWDSASAVVWIIIGLAAGNAMPSKPVSDSPKWIRYIPAGCVLVLCFVFTIAFTSPTARQQQHLRRASEALIQAQNPMVAIQELDQAAAIIPNDPTTTRWRISLRQDLAYAYAQSFADQSLQIQAILAQALQINLNAQQAGLSPLTSARQRGQLSIGAYQITNDQTWLTEAEKAFRLAAQLSPNGLNDHLRLADTQWQLGDTESARQSYKRALEISDNYYLDPDTQLTNEEHDRITERITDLAASHPTTAPINSAP